MRWSDAAEVAIAGASRYILEAGDETWDVQVWVPDESAREGREVPALYVVDPLATFATTLTTVDVLNKLSAGVMGPTAVVGVAPTGDFMYNHPKRFRDMTPTSAAAEVHVAVATHGMGQADAFLALIVEEIAPFVERRHGLQPAGRGIGGWSLGGLLTCHALLTRHGDFDRYLAVSPSLWWDSELLVARAKELSAGSLAGKHLYMGTGELENDLDRMWPPPPPEVRAMIEGQLADADMCGSARRFAEALEVDSGARVRQEIIAGEHHVTVWGAAMTRGLIELYG